MCRKLTLIIVCLFSLIGFTNPALSQGPPPGGGGGGGGGGPTTLSDLGCSPEEIARVNVVDEWECSADLTTLEGQNLDSRVGTLEGQNLDGRLSTFEGQNLNARIVSLEDSSVQLLRTIIVNPVGPTSIENGLELVDAVSSANSLVPAPSATAPAVVLIEPGVYDIGLNFLQIPQYVSIVGLSRKETIIVGGSNFNLVRLSSNSGLRSLTLRPISRGSGKSAISLAYALPGFDNVVIEDFDIETPGQAGTSINGIVSGSGIVLNDNILIRDCNIDVPSGGVIFEESTAKIVGCSIKGNFAFRAAKNSDIQVFNSTLTGITTNTLGGSLTSSLEIFESNIDDLNMIGGDIIIRNSRIDDYSQTGGTASIGGTELGFVNITGGTASCVFSYDSSLSPYDPSCL